MTSLPSNSVWSSGFVSDNYLQERSMHFHEQKLIIFILVWLTCNKLHMFKVYGLLNFDTNFTKINIINTSFNRGLAEGLFPHSDSLFFYSAFPASQPPALQIHKKAGALFRAPEQWDNFSHLCFMSSNPFLVPFPGEK